MNKTIAYPLTLCVCASGDNQRKIELYMYTVYVYLHFYTHSSVMLFNPFTLPLKFSWICIYPIKPLNSSSFSGSARREVTYSSPLSHCNTSALLLKHVSIKLWEPIKAIIQTQTHIVKWLYTHRWEHMHATYSACNPSKWNHTRAIEILDTHGECSLYTFEFIINICVVYLSESLH